jgi:hypothetical protein
MAVCMMCLERVGACCTRRAPAAELRQRLVVDALRGQRHLKRLGVEMRKFPRCRKAAHVGDRLDVVRAQERQEFLQRPRRMADRPDARGHARLRDLSG